MKFLCKAPCESNHWGCAARAEGCTESCFTGVCLSQREEVVQPGEEKAPRRPCSSLPVPKWGLQERWRGTFYKGCSDRTRGNGLKLKEGGEALEQAAQRGYGCPIPGSVQGQGGWGFGQAGLVEGVPAHGMGVELGDL